MAITGQDPIAQIIKRQRELDEQIERANRAKIERDELEQALKIFNKYIARTEAGVATHANSITPVLLDSAGDEKPPTPLRRRVLELFEKTSEGFSARQIAQKLSVSGDKLPSVHTTLSILKKMGHLEQVSLGVYRKAQKSEASSVAADEAST